MVRIRVAALVVRDGNVLLARHVKAGATSYLFPGGGLEPDELAHDALARELREEASTECAPGDLRYVVESRAPDGSRHLVQLVFAVSLRGDVGPSHDPRVAACEWHDIAALRTIALHPAVGAQIADDLDAAAPHPCRYLEAPWVI